MTQDINRASGYTQEHVLRVRAFTQNIQIQVESYLKPPFLKYPK
jgi:hypothetical protein